MRNCKTPQLAHQKTGTDLLIESPVFGLFDDMGTGKSKTVIDAICALAQQRIINAAVIVCPNTVKSNWSDPDPLKGEIAKHGWETLVHGIYEISAGKTLFPLDTLPPCQLQWIIVNYDSVWRGRIENWLQAFMKQYHTAMVLDESHYIKNPGSQRTRGCIRLGQLAQRRYILSGTPITRCPLDIYSQYRFLDWNILGYRNFSSYKQDIVVFDPYGYKVNGRPVAVKSYKNMDKTLQRIAAFYRRVEKDQCLDLPAKIYTKREVPMNEVQQKLYKQMKEKLVAEFGGQKMTATIALTVQLRLAQISAGFLRSTNEDGHEVLTFLNSPKVQEAVELVDMHEGSAIIFFQQHAECQMLGEGLTKAKISYYELHGKIPTDQRKDIIENFQAQARPVLLCQQLTGGIGINLTAADLVIFFSNADGWDYRAQAEDRAHRHGQTRSVTYVDLLSTNKGIRTVDHKILDNVRKKQSLAELLIKTQEDLTTLLASL